jgi:hypothetical protein
MATTTSRSKLEFKQEADRVHERLVEASRREKEAVHDMAYLLADVERRKLYAARNRTSTGDYAVHFGFTRSAGHARDLVNLVKKLEQTPKIRAAFKRGDMDWTKARTAAAAVIAAADDPTSEDRWLARALKHTNEVLEALKREEQGDPAPIRKVLKLSREADADLEQACTMARAMYGRKLTDTEALAIVCRDWAQLQAGGGGEGGRSSDNPANRIVINRCGDCGKAWRETRRGRVEVSQAHAEAAECDSEVSDVRDGPARITKTVPPVTRRHVLDRDGHRCRVPGCTSRGYLHVHHEGGREVVGHDPEKMPALCDVHHTQRHDDMLTIRPDAEVGFRFFGFDGAELTGAPGELAPPAPRASVESGPRSCERPADPVPGSSSSVPEPVTSGPRSREREPAADPLDEVAGRALAGLGLRPRERAQALKSAREALAARDEPVTLEALLHAALVALPTPGARTS